MNNQNLKSNFYRFIVVYIFSSICSFLGIVGFQASNDSILFYIIPIFIFEVLPFVFGILLLKNCSSIKNNAVSVLLPTTTLFFIILFAYLTINGFGEKTEDLLFVLTATNISQLWYFNSILNEQTPNFVLALITGGAAINVGVMAFIGLLCKTGLNNIRQHKI